MQDSSVMRCERVNVCLTVVAEANGPRDQD